MANKTKKLLTGRAAWRQVQRFFENNPGFLNNLVLCTALEKEKTPAIAFAKLIAMGVFQKIDCLKFEALPEPNYDNVVSVLDGIWKSFSPDEQKLIAAEAAALLVQGRLPEQNPAPGLAEKIFTARQRRAQHLAEKKNQATRVVSAAQAAKAQADAERASAKAEIAQKTAELAALLSAEGHQPEAVEVVFQALEAAKVAYLALFGAPAAQKEVEEVTNASRRLRQRRLVVNGEVALRRVSRLFFKLCEQLPGLLQVEFRLGGFVPGKTDPKALGSTVVLSLLPEDQAAVEALLALEEDVTVEGHFYKFPRISVNGKQAKTLYKLNSPPAERPHAKQPI